jgi:hypothetical protein
MGNRRQDCVRTVSLWSFGIPLDSINTIDTSWFSSLFPGSGARNQATSSALMSQSEMTTTEVSAIIAPNPVPIKTATWLGMVAPSVGMSWPNAIGETCIYSGEEKKRPTRMSDSEEPETGSDWSDPWRWNCLE